MKVGSGFPMNGYDFGGKMDPRERAHYANHPWNLNNLPVLRESVLSHLETGISGTLLFSFLFLSSTNDRHFINQSPRQRMTSNIQ